MARPVEAAGLAVRRPFALVLVAGALLATGCAALCVGDGECLFPCAQNSDCPRGTYCAANGQCEGRKKQATLRLSQPDPVYQAAAGEAIAIAGRVGFMADLGWLQADVVDALDCGGGASRGVDVVGDSGHFGDFAFDLGALPMPVGGGTLQVVFEAPGLRLEQRSELVDSAPATRIELVAPVRGWQQPRALYAPLAGRVVGAQPAAARWRVANRGSEIAGPITIDASGAFDPLVVPLAVGSNSVSIEIDDADNPLRCARQVEGGADASDLMAATLVWSEQAIDLDLHLVPPSQVLGAGDCRVDIASDVDASTCAVVDTGSGSSGPEALAISAPAVIGSYGIAVVLFAGPSDLATAAFVTLAARGQQLVSIRSNVLDTSLGRVWLVGVVEVSADGVIALLPIDRIVDSVPTAAPDQWR